jgi:hypothetical protein
MSKSDDIAAKLSQAASDLALWRGLLEHPGWKAYEKIIDEQMKLRQSTVCLTPLASFGKSLEQEFMKGEAAGLGLAIVVPKTQAEMAKMEVEILNVELDQEKEHETDRRPDGGSRVDDDDFSRE